MFPTYKPFETQLTWEERSDTIACWLDKFIWYTDEYKTYRGSGAEIHGVKSRLNPYAFLRAQNTEFQAETNIIKPRELENEI